MRKFVTAFASNTVLANISIFLMFLLGFVSIQLMQRETFPEMSLDRITISVAFPGADPEEIEEGILRKIEEALQGQEGVKELTTHARENIGTAVVTVLEGSNTQRVLDRVRLKVDAINTFPVDAENPVISELILEDVVTILTLSGDMPEHRMKEWAERTKTALLQRPEITVVDIFGARDYEISIEISEARLREHDLTHEEVMTAVRRNNLNVPGGLIRNEQEEIRLRTLGRKYTGEELAEIPLITRPDGTRIRLGDVARIVDGFVEEGMKARVDGSPALFLYVKRTSEQDSLDISAAVREFLEEQRALLPEGLLIAEVFDTTDMLRARINLLIRNGIIGLSLVFLLLWLFLDLRLSFWAGMGMPISIAGALVILWAVGGSINMISLFGLIMVLGIIVDDAIVVGEAIYRRQQKGDVPPLQAAVDGVCEVGMPVFGAVATTIIAFLPLMFVGGIMGKFISILPVVVIACLVVSLFECLLLLPAHLGEKSIKERRTGGKLHKFFNALHDATGTRLENFIENHYEHFLRTALSWRYVFLSAAVGILILTAGALGGGHIPVSMFSAFDSFILTTAVEFPDGTPLEVTDAALQRIESAALSLNDKIATRSGDPAIQRVMRLAGQNLGDQYAAGGHNIGSVQIILVESTDRRIDSDAIRNLWEEAIGPIPGAEAVSISGIDAGPPGMPVDIRIRGTDLTRMEEASREVLRRLATFNGLTQIQTDFRPGRNEIRFRLKEEAESLGLTVEDLGRQISTGYFGGEALRIQRGRDDIRVMVRYTADERSRAADLQQVRIRLPDGRALPLYAVAHVEVAPGYAEITRVDGMRIIGVSADVNTAVANAEQINRVIEREHFPELHQAYPGVFFEFQGEKQDSADSLASLKISFPVALIGIYVIIAAIFRSYIQPMIIMLTVPFGIIGAVIGHLLRGIDVSMMSLFGIVALAGVVVNDAIVLIEAYNYNIAHGLDVREAIVEAGKRRFRAVFLTTLSTVGGLTPLILERDLQAQFLIPMALSIAAGVAFATLLTLLLIPNLLLILNDIRCFLHYLFTGQHPQTRLAVEPARHREPRESLPS
ncbi:MAG: efflux RND transporter permease subunit [Verrucomicrobia bacterium]|nr:efflux RND transporter permease subunit [Verrucomicrobiota bacterium]MCH8528844.1 efflux RND transporter permease subunit [Kiritimatiellia bacterium]